MAFATISATTAPVDEAMRYQPTMRSTGAMLPGPGGPMTGRWSAYRRLARRTRGGPAYASPGVRSAFSPGRRRATVTVRSSAPRTIAELERRLERRRALEQVVGVGDRLAAGRDDQVARLDAGGLGQ